MTTIAVIPARGGSKGVPRKNVLPLAGKPLIQYSIEQALAASSIDAVYVSTDDAEIASVSEAAGAAVIMRPEALANDTASSESALEHAVTAITRLRGEQPDTVVFLQCTSPIRAEDDLDSALGLYRELGADSLLSVVESHRFFWRESNGRAEAVNYDPLARPRRQDMEPGLMENGSLYIFDTAGFLESGNRLFGHIAVYIMAPETAYEIDEDADFVVLEALINHLETRRASQ